ncbi:MAG TPA: A/G-specific adenine glycosylase [Caulobacteraceae bacterium]|nr:A/G-specific adenine glycosylase [Caulobacteraceae bacterium]
MQKARLRRRLLDWYDRNARALPWRVSPAPRARGVRADPYRVWLSEVMLQQTTIPHAAGYFLKFTGRWPSVQALAAADDGEVMGAWAGLGYYARARNLLACARLVAGELGGRFPDTEAKLRDLPGIGAYTAAAIAAIAFDRPANVVDANVERVIARLHAVETPLPAAKPQLVRLAGALADAERPGDWAQAMMDLGAMVCRPAAPLCDRCPLADACQAGAAGDPDPYPRKSPKPDRPHRHGAVFVLTRGAAVALDRRPSKGLLGGMLGLPTTDWVAERPSEAAARAAAPADAAWRRIGQVEHGFTHFSITLDVYRAEAEPAAAPELIWLPYEQALAETPTLFAKALRLGLLG